MIFNIKDFGAVADGNTMNTKAIQKAIESFRVSAEHKQYLKTLKIKS